MLGIGADRDLPTVLLIDDDMVSREVIATLLTLTGYTLHTAADGVEALAKLDSKQCVPQVILVDVQMPGLHGLRLIEKLRASSAAAIYTISASAPSDELREATDGFLQKPFGPEELKKALEKYSATQPEAGAEPDEPVLSGEVLSQFRQMMPESTVRDVYVAVVTDLKKRSNALETAIAQGDAAEVRRIGHAIKGGCGMAGARQAARLGTLFEAESDQLNNSAVILGDLRVATRNLERMLELEFPS
jgi:CheY-like chemotaxis protein/HPt (histidine-containing phosphotransfer) domain-containing protein